MDILLTLGFALLVWWAGTVLLMYLNARPESTYPSSLVGVALFLGISLALIEAAGSTAQLAGAYIGFLGAVMLWGCLELPHLMGFVTGPVKSRCPSGLRGWRRFIRAIGVGLYHDLLVLLTGTLLWWHAFEVGSAVAAGTFTTLWLLRWSAKLNLFFGVANFDPEFLPTRMDYLKSYMRVRRMNPIFPITMLIACAFCIWCMFTAVQADSAYDAVVATLLGVLALLGIFEHLIMMVPLTDSSLWRWALSSVSQRS